MKPTETCSIEKELGDEIAEEYLTMDEYANSGYDSYLADGQDYEETALDECGTDGTEAVRTEQTMQTLVEEHMEQMTQTLPEEPCAPALVSKTTQTLQAINNALSSLEVKEIPSSKEVVHDPSSEASEDVISEEIEEEKQIPSPSRNPVHVFWRFLGRDPTPAREKKKIKLTYSKDDKGTSCICDGKSQYIFD